jgi:hypothetical protein
MDTDEMVETEIERCEAIASAFEQAAERYRKWIRVLLTTAWEASQP